MKNQVLFIALSACFIFGSCQQLPQKISKSETEYESCWSSVGSAGIIDGSFENVRLGTTPRFFISPEQDPLPLNQLNLDHDGVVSIRANVTTNLSIRYNIGYLMEKRPYGKVLTVRYLVTDKRMHRVIVILKKYSMNAPPATEKAEIVKIFDSNGFDGSPNFQSHSVDIAGNENIGVFDFSNYAYYIEVLMIKTKNTNPYPPIPIEGHTAPAVGIISICDPAVQ